MENENVVLCPVHGGSLCISPKIITFLGTHYNALEGKCPQCRVVYLDQKIKGIARFTYEGTNYQYLPELENWRVKQEQKKEEERKKAEEKNELAKKYPFLEIGIVKIRLHPNKADHCPEHGTKVGSLACKLYDDTGIELMTATGGYCSRCNALYLDKHLRESLEKYVSREPLKLSVKICGGIWEDIPPITVLKVQFPIKKNKAENKKQVELKKENTMLEQARKKYGEERLQEYPFLKTGDIKIETVQHHPNNCPVHQEELRTLQCRLQEKEKEWKIEFSGFYCPKCNCIYQKKRIEKDFIPYIKAEDVQTAKYVFTPIGKEWKKAHPIEVSELKLIDIKQLIAKSEHSKNNTDALELPKIEEKSTSKVDEALFKISAYQKFNREIVEILATVNGVEKYIRVLTSVKYEDERKCVENEILERESVSIGRELLGRIAHDQLGEFTSKYGTIKIHNYKVWPGQEHHLDGFTRFCDPENIQNITIMSQNNISRDSDEYEMVTALVYCANRVEPVYIDVYYSKRQNKYFINEESYRQYRLRYGLPYVHLVADEYDGDMDYGNLRKNSELNLYGYTVAKTAEMSTGERQRLLQQLMDNGLMSKHQIVNHLEWLIHRQSGRVKMEDACDCWREDLRFVNRYRLNAQRKIQGRFVYGKTVLR